MTAKNIVKPFSFSAAGQNTRLFKQQSRSWSQVRAVLLDNVRVEVPLHSSRGVLS